MRKMRAVGFRRYGPPEVLESIEIARPEPAPDEVLIRVAAAGVNPADSMLRGGKLRLFARLELPIVPGADVAGVVEAVGQEVARFRPGAAVYAMLPAALGGGYAQYAAATERFVAPAPPGLSLAEAASVPLTALTALQALRDKAGLKAGDHALIHGASGGVGTFAVQIAKTMGARVTAVSSARNAELVRGLGADEILDYARDNVAAGGPRYDAIFGAVNVLPVRTWRRALRPGGVIVTVNPVFGNGVLRWLARTIGGFRLEGVFVQPNGADLETISGWISAGTVGPVIERTYPLGDAAAAHRLSESKRVRGKLVLVVDEELAAAKGEER